MSRSFLIVLPKLMRSGVAPAASACSISTTDAVSKHEPSRASRSRISGAGIGLDRVEHAGVRQRPGEAVVIVAHDVEVDDQARPVLAIAGEKILDAISHSGIPRLRGRPRQAR